MRPARGASGLSGILLVDKPAGLTSHDVVARVRHALGERRVGHAGTLDPAATGLLVVLVGSATRLAPLLTAATKSYLADICFGIQTDTDDAEGEIVRRADVPDEILDPVAAAGIVASLVGTHTQVPPGYSAIKVDGQTSHRLARAGEKVALAPREIRILNARLTGIEMDACAVWHVDLTVSKGTYVRAIARDLGEACESAAHLCGLRRTHSGALSLNDAHSLEDIDAATLDGSEHVQPLFTDPVRAIGLPVIDVDAACARLVANGVPLDVTLATDLDTGDLVAIVHGEYLLAVYSRADDALRPDVVLSGGIRRRSA